MSIKSHDIKYLAQLINSSINVVLLHHNLLDNSDKIMLLHASRRLQKISDQDLNLAEVALENSVPPNNFGFPKQEKKDA